MSNYCLANPHFRSWPKRATHKRCSTKEGYPKYEVKVIWPFSNESWDTKRTDSRSFSIGNAIRSKTRKRNASQIGYAGLWPNPFDSSSLERYPVSGKTVADTQNRNPLMYLGPAQRAFHRDLSFQGVRCFVHSWTKRKNLRVLPSLKYHHESPWKDGLSTVHHSKVLNSGCNLHGRTC